MGLFDKMKGMLGGGAPAPASPEEIAQLQAIAQRPDDMEARLTYARLLDAKKDPMGAYIRCEVEKIRLNEEDPQFKTLTDQADGLMEQHGKRWVKPFKELELEPLLGGYHIPGLWFSRGMVEEITIDKRGAVPGKIDRLFELAPALRKLVFARCTPDWKSIAAAPQMQRIKAMDLSEVKLTLDDVRALAGSPHLLNIEELDLSSKEEGPELAKVIATSPHWKKLKLLKLSSCRIGLEGAKHLAQSLNLAALEELDVGYDELNDEGLAVLARSPHLARLKRLNVRSNDLTPAAGKLIAGATFRKLEALEVESNKLGGEGVSALAAAGNCAALRKLGLGWNGSFDAAIIDWAGSPNLKHVRELNLSGNDLTDAGIAALAGSPGVANVVELDLSTNALSSADALTRSPYLKKLRKLTLYSVTLEEEEKAKLRATFGDDAIHM